MRQQSLQSRPSPSPPSFLGRTYVWSQPPVLGAERKTEPDSVAEEALSSIRNREFWRRT